MDKFTTEEVYYLINHPKEFKNKLNDMVDQINTNTA
jgi:hypothetical protein